MRKVIWGLTLLCMGFIFYMSSRSVEESRADSAKLMAALNLVEQEEDAMNVGNWEMLQFHNMVRKNAHLIIFAALGILFFASLYGYWGGIWVSGAISVLLTAVYGATDEIHQLFTHRGASLTDVLYDTLGGLIGVLLVSIIFLLVEKNKAIKTLLSRIYDFEPKNGYIRRINRQ